MTRRNWLVFAAMLIAASALVLAGCGGDDNGGLSAEDMARLAAAEEATAAAQATADQAAMDAAMAHDEAHEAEEAATAADMRAEAAETAAAAADMRAEMAEDAAAAADMRAMDAEAAIEAAEDEIHDLELQLAMREQEDAQYDPDDPGGTREDAADRAAADRIYDSADRAASQNQDDDRRDNNRTEPEAIEGGVELANLVAARLGQAPGLTIAIEGGPDLDTDNADSVETDMPRIPGWQGVALSKAGPGAISQRALVYTDIEQSVRAFGDVYRYNWGLVTTGATAGQPSATAPLTEAGRTHFNVGDAAAMNAELRSGRAVLEHGLSTSTGVLERDLTATVFTIRGTFDGVPGQYVFEGTPTITLDPSDGSVTLNTSARVLFRADNHEQLLPDTDYLAFGVWEEVPDNPTLANPGRVRPFVKGNAPAYTVADVDGLSGKATYSGNAVGHWATREAGSHEAEQGRFTATATLTANFDAADSTIIPEDPVTPMSETSNSPASDTIASVTKTGVVLTGEITGFMNESGEAMPGWLVNLDMGRMEPDMAAGNLVTEMGSAADLYTARRNTANAEVDVLGTTTGKTGSLSFTGVWEAWMHGNNTDTYPTGIVGNFHADAGTPHPVATPEARIDLFRDEGFAGVVGSFAAR